MENKSFKSKSSMNRLLLLCGGESPEHEISLLSSQSVLKALNQEKHEPHVVGIQKNGEWRYYEDISDVVEHPQDPNKIALKKTGIPIVLGLTQHGPALIRLSDGQVLTPLDVAFPILHGPFGEDGTIQGLLKMMHLPFVGASILGTGIGMDKAVMKRLLKEAGLPMADFLVFYHPIEINPAEIEATFGFPVFVKPANMGSSVGVSKINGLADFDQKVAHAFQFDHKILLEKAIEGREIECSVLGNEDPRVSLPGEIIPKHEFYSYEAKYLDEQGADLQVPAALKSHEIKTIQALARQAYKTLECEGMARLDLFLTQDGHCYINEINTIPGFTKISMYPKLWAVSGLPYTELIDELIELAQARARREKQLARNLQLL